MIATNGFINVNKPSGVTSNKAVGIVKYRLRKMGFDGKIGHMGTLDPLASGVLPIAIGRATRLFDYSLDKVKVYEATFMLGASSPSLDIDSEVTKEAFTMPDKDSIVSAIRSQIGVIKQTPPIFSAKSVQGRRAYELARKGVVFSLSPKTVTIDDIDLTDVDEIDNTISVRIVCRGGTYVRAIGRDVASVLGTHAVMTSLKRTQSGIFTIEKSISLDQVVDGVNIDDFVISTDTYLSSFPTVKVTGDEVARLRNGIRISLPVDTGVFYAVFDGEKICGIGHTDENGEFYIKTWLL